MKTISFALVYVISSTAIFYQVQSIVSAPDCECTIPLTWIVVLIATTGVIVGISIYLYTKKTIIPDRLSSEDVKETTRFLPRDQRKIVEAIIENKGEISQSSLPDETDLSKVKISRKLKDLERQKIIKKQENGMSNKVMLENKFEDILL